MSLKKILFLIFLSIFVSFCFFIIIFPKLLSTKIGKQFLTSQIEKRTRSKIDIESFSLTWIGPQKIKNLKYQDANLTLQADKITSNMSLFSLYLALKDEKFYLKNNTSISNLNIDFNHPESSLKNVNIFIKTHNKKLSSVQISGKTFANNTTGDLNALFDFQDSQIKANVLGKNIPVIAIDHLLLNEYKNSLVQIFGPSLNIRLNSTLNDLKGPINIGFETNNSKGSLDLFFSKDHFYLTNEAFLILNIPGINPVFFKNITYLKNAENYPTILKISNIDSYIPFSPFKLENIKFQHAVLDLNKITVSNTGIIKTVRNFVNKQPTQKLDIWFTHTNIIFEKGIINTDRTDFLIDNSLHLCIWGKINLLENSLKMYLGITADTLEKFFGIKNLPEDYVIKIPIKGNIRSPQIDITAASAKIFALSTLQKNKGISSIVGNIITKFQKSKDIPPPKRPFPWERQY